MNRRRIAAYPGQGRYQKIAKAKLLIDTQYSEKLSLDTICMEASMSKFHFVRLFKNIYGVTPLQYLIDVRIAAAKGLIASGISMTDACWKVGFDSISSFMVLFKERTGRSSSLYRNEKIQFETLLRQRPTMSIPSCLAFRRKRKEQ